MYNKFSASSPVDIWYRSLCMTIHCLLNWSGGEKYLSGCHSNRIGKNGQRKKQNLIFEQVDESESSDWREIH